MLGRTRVFALTTTLSVAAAAAQAPPAKSPAPDPTAKQTKDQPTKPNPSRTAKKPPDTEAELQRAIEEAATDRAALVRNLEDYLRRFPEAPRKAQVYRAIVESAMQLRDMQRALDYAERIITLRPDDAEMMLFAVDLLERAGDDASLTRAVGYATRVLDRVEKSAAEGKPARMSQAAWETEQKKVQMSLYLLRGRLQMERHNYDAAVADLDTSYRLLANPAVALRLGEIAELRKDYNKAIEHYVSAFVLPDQHGQPVDRWEVRRKLGNLWQLVHGSEAGLGERLLQAYDKVAAGPQAANSAERNKGASDPLAFVLRRSDGTAPVRLAESKGKVLVLNFWATWCVPCRELEPLFEKVGRHFEGRDDVMFLAVNGDEDETHVAPYLEKEKMRTTVVFADGLDRFLDIRAYPTVIVLDRGGRIIYRAQGFDPDDFEANLTAAIGRALAGTS